MKTKLTLYWEEDFKNEVKQYAKDHGISLSALVEESLDEWLNDGKNESSKKQEK